MASTAGVRRGTIALLERHLAINATMDHLVLHSAGPLAHVRMDFTPILQDYRLVLLVLRIVNRRYP